MSVTSLSFALNFSDPSFFTWLEIGSLNIHITIFIICNCIYNIHMNAEDNTTREATEQTDNAKEETERKEKHSFPVGEDINFDTRMITETIDIPAPPTFKIASPPSAPDAALKVTILLSM